MKIKKYFKESVIDFPQNTLCPDIWYQGFSLDGMTKEWQLQPEVIAIINNICSQLEARLDLKDYKLNITGSITSNQYTDNTDIDLHFICPEFKKNYKTVDDAIKAIRNEFKNVNPQKIKNHPIEVYYQASEFQDYMSIGCYNFTDKEWIVGPELIDSKFNPYSEYYQSIQRLAKPIVSDIRNQILETYEKAVICYKTSNDLKSKIYKKSVEDFKKMIFSSKKLYLKIRKMRKVYNDPKSKEEALKNRDSKKWHVADATFKLFDKYGYLQILREFVLISELLENSKDEEIINSSIAAVIDAIKNSIGNLDKLA